MHYLLLLTIYFLPAYTLRFSLWGLPANVLLVWMGFVLVSGVIWLLYTGRLVDFKNYCISIPLWLSLPSAGFLVAGTLSLLVANFTMPAVGQYLVLVLLPILLGLLSGFVFKTQRQSRSVFIWGLMVFVALAGVLAVLQYWLLWFLPPEYWGNSQEPKRAIAFFEHPNGFALFTAPVLAFLLPLVSGLRQRLAWLLWGLGVAGLLLSLSRGGWLGLLIAGGVWAWLAGGKFARRLFVGLAFALVVIVLITPNLRYRVILPFMGEKSSVARFSLWDTGWKMIADSPILGKGLTGFSQNWYTYNTDPGLLHYNFPHNWFLNFWIDTGLLGVLSMSVLVGVVMWRIRRKPQDRFVLAAGLFMLAVVVHGMIDIPYFKNDLAALFWLILAAGLWGDNLEQQDNKLLS